MEEKIYVCRYCGKSCPSFDCSCVQKLENKKLWDNNPRNKRGSEKLEKIKFVVTKQLK